MKKLLKLFGLVAIASLLFVGCPGPSGNGGGNENPPVSEPGSGKPTGGATSEPAAPGTDTPAEKVPDRKLLTTSTNLNVKIADIKAIEGYEDAKLIYVIGNKTKESKKGGWGGGYPAVQNSEWQNFTKLEALGEFRTPAAGKTVSIAYKVTDVLAALTSDAYYLGVNAYNDAVLISITIAWDVPDVVSADLTKLSAYSAEKSGIVKNYEKDGDFKQYGTAFDISFADLGINGHNSIEIIGQTIVAGENKLQEWTQNFGAHVYKGGDDANKTAGYNLGTVGHYLTWDNKAHADYDTLHIQSNAEACDQLIITKINLLWGEEGTCEVE